MFTILFIILVVITAKMGWLDGDVGCAFGVAMFFDFLIVMAIVGVWAGWW